MPDGDHIRFLLRVLSDSLLVPQTKDGRGRERLLSNHCAVGIALLTSSLIITEKPTGLVWPSSF